MLLLPVLGPRTKNNYNKRCSDLTLTLELHKVLEALLRTRLKTNKYFLLYHNIIAY